MKLFFGLILFLDTFLMLLAGCLPAEEPVIQGNGTALPDISVVPANTNLYLTPSPTGRWQTYSTADGLPSSSITAVTTDAQGGVWVGSPRGAAYFFQNQWQVYRREDGLLSDLVLDVAVDKQGTVWFGTDKGLSRFDGQTWTGYTIDDGLQSGFIQAVAVDHLDGVWLGFTGAGADWAFGNGVARLDDGGTAIKGDDCWLFYPPTSQRMAGGLVSSIIDAGPMGMWFGLTPEGTVRVNKGQGGIWRLNGFDSPETSDDLWQKARFADQSMLQTITALALTPEKTLWVGTPSGLMHLPPPVEETFEFGAGEWLTTADGLPGNRILSLAVGPDGRLWVGTDAGLGHLDGETIKVFTVENGLPANQIRGIAFDPYGFVWVATPSGISALR